MVYAMHGWYGVVNKDLPHCIIYSIIWISEVNLIDVCKVEFILLLLLCFREQTAEIDELKVAQAKLKAEEELVLTVYTCIHSWCKTASRLFWELSEVYLNDSECNLQPLYCVI